jgi:hypothetical protein
MPIAEDDPRLVFQPFDAEPPAGLCMHYKNSYWACHSEKGLILWRAHPRETALSPQCNTQELVAKMFVQKMYPWAEVRFIPSAFVRSRPQDWS